MGELHPPVSLAGEPLLAHRPACGEHSVQLYRGEAELGAALAAFVAAGLRAGDGALIIGSMPRWTTLLQALGALDIDSRAAAQRGQLRFFGARTVLAACMGRGVPDRLLFNETASGVLGQARLPGVPLRVYSDVSDVLWRDDAREAALALESFWNSLDAPAFALLCACPLDSLDAAAYDGGMQRICAAHTHFAPAGDCRAFDDAVRQAIEDVLEPRLVRMLQSLSSAHRPAAAMPAGQASLFWLKANMPRTADRVLSRIREAAPVPVK
jgi:hypothetical protein